MSGILCLKWNNHTSTFIKTLDNLRSKELYCDATIACHGKYFPVHRFVLTTCSEYFEEIFERTQCKHPFIIVKDVEELQLEALLNYMYKGEVNVLQDRLPGLIRAAEALKVRGLAVSEEDADEKKPVKEKRKSNSSPLQPKTKRRVTESKSLPVNVPIPDSDDDDISEILHEKSNLPNQNLNPEVSHTENTSDVESIEKSQSGLEENTNVEKEDINGENRTSENEVEDIKVEPSEIFEAVEDDFPSQSMESQSQARGKEESLFVSLLSPNNSHSLSEEDLMAINDTNSQAMPQCSSWSDDVSTNSDKMQDEIPGKAQWLESEEFDHLALDPYSYLATNEEEDSTNFPSNLSEDSSLHNKGQISGANSDITGKNMKPFSRLHLSDCSNILTSNENIHDEFSPKIKEEITAMESLGLSDASSSAIAALSKFQFPDCASNYASLLMDDASDFGHLPDSDMINSEANILPHPSGDGSKAKFHCITCPFKCKDRAALKLHIMRRHTGEKPFSCSICSYRCTTKDMLKIHTRKHTGERPFSCPYCSCRMSVKSSLKRHILLKHIQGKKHHSSTGSAESSNLAPGSSLNIKTFKCSHCSYETQLKSNLNLHTMRIHTGEKPIACVLCPYRTTTKSQLQKHVRKHTGEKPFACSFCSYKAAQKHCLLRHMYVHTR